jgi:hypothetical protein
MDKQITLRTSRTLSAILHRDWDSQNKDWTLKLLFLKEIIYAREKKIRFVHEQILSHSQTTASRTALGPTQPPIQWVPGDLSLGVKRPGHEADNSPSSSAEVKERVELYLHSPNTSSWRGA